MANSSLDSVQLRGLVARTQAGDSAAENELVRAILGRFEGLARRMLNRFPDLRQWEQTADVVQDSIIRLFRALKSVTPESTRDFFNLAAEQIRRQLIDLARRHRRANVNSLSASEDSGPADLRDSTGNSQGFEIWSRFHEAVEELPLEEREVVGLTFYHGWTQKQIAELFQVDERTIRRRWQSACLNLNRVLQGQLPGI